MFHECDRDCKAYVDRDHPLPGRWQIGEWKFRRCPKSTIDDPSIFEFIEAYNWLADGITPNGIGYLHEANKYVEAMSFIRTQVAEHAREQAENGRSKT